MALASPFEKKEEKRKKGAKIVQYQKGFDDGFVATHATNATASREIFVLGTFQAPFPGWQTQTVLQFHVG